jgi:hypothetical protein
VRELFFNSTGVIALIGFIAFIAFALPPSPPWLAWPALAVSGACGFRILIVGDRRHHQVRDELDIDDDDPKRKRTDELVQLLKRKDR